MNLINIIKNLVLHPLNRGREFTGILMFIRYQFATRLLDSKFLVNWINDSKFLISKHETGLSGNLYCGLIEYESMSFLLHYLRKGDDFYDIGANVGAYTILASGVVGAKSISFEPVLSTYDRLIDQIKINRIEHLVDLNNFGVGDKADKLEFTDNLGCMNKVNTDPNCIDVTTVNVIKLDDYYNATSNSLVKIDVEGFESFVLQGGGNFFSSQNVSVLIIEINGSGGVYGVDDIEIHKLVTSFGFHAISYEPFGRKISPLDSYNLVGNTIYAKDVVFAQQRVASSDSVVVHTVGDLNL